MAVVRYLRGIEQLLAGNQKLSAVTVKALLWRSAYVPNANNHAVRSDITAEVPAGAGYALGGQNCPVSLTRDSANGRIELIFSAVVWTAPAGSTLTARGAAYYIALGAAASDVLLAYNDFTADLSASNEAFNLGQAVVRFGA